MKTWFVVVVLVALVAGLCASTALAQVTGTVKGECKDTQGNPIVGATVQWVSAETGRKYEIKTDKKGDYFSLGITPGKYTVTLLQDGKELYHFTNFPVGVDEAVLDFDLKKEQAQQAKGAGVSAEELKKRQEAEAQAAKEGLTVKQLNEKLALARDAIKGGNYDQAITTMAEATQMDASRDILWYTLGDAYMGSAPKQTDPAEKKKRYDDAVDSYQKAIQAKNDVLQKGEKDPDANKKLAGYYNNLANAQGRIGKVDDAVKSYSQAAQLDPPGTAGYYYNIGAVLTNAGKTDEAIAAFDKSIAADPNKADAYYQKGVNLIAKATTDPKTGKITPAPGTQEALNKYLELQPNGPFADGAKGMIQYIGGTIETSFGKSSKKTASKPK